MKRKIYAKYEGWVYDHNGHGFHGKIHLYENGQKWVIRDKNGYCRFKSRLFYIANDSVWVEIPKNDLEIEQSRQVLKIHLDSVLDFLNGNPISGSYNEMLKRLREIEAKFFTNSINFIMEGTDEYRKI